MLTLAPHPDAALARWRAEVVDRALALRHRPMTGEPADRALAASSAVLEELGARLVAGRPGPGQRLEQVLADGEPVGWLWTGQDSPDTVVVLDVSLADPDAHATAVRAQLEARAVAAGVRRVELSAADDPTHRAWVAAAATTVVGTRMALRLDVPPPAPSPGRVRLRPMTPGEVEQHLDGAVEAFAAVRHRADPGRSAEDCLAESRAIHARVLPEGAATPGHHFLAPEAPETSPDQPRVGLLWVHLRPPSAYVYDVAVDETLRGRGLGRAVVAAAAAWCRERGAAALGLHVFADNRAARRVYDALGFAVVEDHHVVDLTAAQRVEEPVTGRFS